MSKNTKSAKSAKSAPAEGSYHDQGRCPAVGAQVWARIGMFGDEVAAAEVVTVTNIDGRGLGNTYMDVRLADGSIRHVSISSVYDHKPRQVRIVDAFGPVTVWR